MDRPRSSAAPTRPVVLILAGDEDIGALYAFALSAMGFDVIPARDPSDAYRRACELRPDIIVTDLTMPHSDGWPFLESLRQNLRTCEIPVVALSADVPRSLEEDAVERQGIAAFFLKSCSLHELAAGLRHVLDRRTRVSVQH